MKLWPAIDIRDGRCVRLRQGDFAEETQYGDPLEVALKYRQAGAERLHVVDLDAARSGEPVNREIVLAIARQCGLVVQASGGVRDAKAAAVLLEGGVERVIVGTAAVAEGRGLLEELVAAWPGRVVVGLDFRGEERELALRGWTEPSGVSLDDALEALGSLELAGVVVTDISRDGTGSGGAVATYGELLESSRLPLIASGGIGTLADIEALAALERNGRRLAGTIVGKALLSGAMTLQDARRAAGDSGS